MKFPKFDSKKLNQLYDYDKNTLGISRVKNDLDSLAMLMNRNDFHESEIRHLKNYAVIRIVTNIETIVKNISIHLIDNYGKSYSKLFKEPIMTIPLTKIEKIKSEEMTIGKIVATNFSFQSKKEIDDVLSALTGIQFIQQLKNYEIVDGNHFTKNWDEFFNIFDLRHNLVHTVSAEVDYTIEEINQLGIATADFIQMCILIIFGPIYQKEPNKLKEKDKVLFNSMHDFFQNS